MTRKEANMEIIRLLVNEINSNPDLRFNQILSYIGVTKTVRMYDDHHELLHFNNVDFNEEPTQTLSKIKDFLSKNK